MLHTNKNSIDKCSLRLYDMFISNIVAPKNKTERSGLPESKGCAINRRAINEYSHHGSFIR